MTPDAYIDKLGLTPHSEGGYYRQTWHCKGNGRPKGTSIYLLLLKGQRTRWHMLDVSELWHYYAGAPLLLMISPTRYGPLRQKLLGADVTQDQYPQQTVAPRNWQCAESIGDFTLAGCTMAPGFQFENCTLAPDHFFVTGEHQLQL